MLDNKFFLLLVNFLWMVGLFGTLFTIVYTLQYRRKRWWNVGHSNNVPRTLVPLYLALATLCGGLMLHAYMAANLVGMGVAVVWATLALLFLLRCLLTVGSAIQAGWDEPLVGGSSHRGWQRFAQWPLFALLLLLVNVGLLGWWGNLQLNADPAVQAVTQTSTGSNPLPNVFQPSATPTPADTQVLLPRLNIKPPANPAPAAITATVAGAITGAPAVTATLALTTPATAAGVAAVVTLAPAQLQITATPPTPDPISQQLLSTTAATASGVIALPPIVVATPAAPAVTTPVTSTTALITATTGLTTLTTVTDTATSPGNGARVQSPLGANVRAAPSTTAPILTLLPDQSPLTINGRTADSRWLAIRLVDGTQGWIAAELVAAPPAIIATVPVLTP